MTEVSENKKKLYLSWDIDSVYDGFEHVIEQLIHDLQYDDDGNEIVLPTGVYGIPRGGLVMATVISNRLGIPMLAAPCDGCIVVDDLADSGVTLKHYADCGYKICTWGYKANSIVVPDWYYATFTENTWVVFPWEK